MDNASLWMYASTEDKAMSSITNPAAAWRAVCLLLSIALMDAFASSNTSSIGEGLDARIVWSNHPDLWASFKKCQSFMIMILNYDLQMVISHNQICCYNIL